MLVLAATDEKNRLMQAAMKIATSSVAAERCERCIQEWIAKVLWKVLPFQRSDQPQSSREPMSSAE